MAFTRTVAASISTSLTSFSRSKSVSGESTFASQLAIAKPHYAATANSTNERITAVAHGLTTGDTLKLTTSFTGAGSMPGALSNSTIYYAAVIDADTLQVSETRGGSAVNISSNGGTFGILPCAEFTTDIPVNVATVNVLKFLGIKVSGSNSTASFSVVIYYNTASAVSHTIQEGNDFVFPSTTTVTDEIEQVLAADLTADNIARIIVVPAPSDSPHTGAATVTVEALFDENY